MTGQIQLIVRQHIMQEDGMAAIQRKLMNWWSSTYNRPLKDPVLLSYTLEELMYEYFTHIERERVAKERRDADDDKIEEDKLQAAEDWADKAEAEDIARMEVQQKPKDPTKDPENIRWMEEQMKQEIEKAKDEHGDDFGEDVEVKFE